MANDEQTIMATEPDEEEIEFYPWQPGQPIPPELLRQLNPEPVKEMIRVALQYHQAQEEASKNGA